MAILPDGQNVRARSEDTVPTKSMACSLLLICLLCATPLYAQVGRPLGSGSKSNPNDAPAGVDESRDRLARDMAKKANADRQAALKIDTDRLVKLAAELKDYVDKTNENMLSIEVLKKAEEIEKLAHSVKEKMKGPN